MFSTSTTVIKASDFSNNTTDVNRNTWTPGTMRMASEALAGAPVAIVCDRQTGHTVLNARLGSVVALYHGGMGVQVTYAINEEGKEQTTNFRLHDIGDTIVPLVETDAKWRAIRRFSDERGAAITLAMATDKARGCDWGVWDATVHERQWHVSYTPHMGNPAFADKRGTYQWWSVDLDKVRATAGV
jgi:hypothetical protein